MWSQVPPRPVLATEPILRIESTEAVSAACDLATLLDAPIADAVAFALRTQLRRERALQPSPEQRLRAIHEFVSALAQMPVDDEHDADPAHTDDGDDAEMPN